jgi:hypothetical protein
MSTQEDYNERIKIIRGRDLFTIGNTTILRIVVKEFQTPVPQMRLLRIPFQMFPFQENIQYRPLSEMPIDANTAARRCISCAGLIDHGIRMATISPKKPLG